MGFGARGWANLDVSLLEESFEIITGELRVSENLGQKSWADGVATVHWNCGRSVV